MPTYLEISVNVPQVSGVFHYHVPARLERQVRTGHLVEVPFGKQRVQGVVLREIQEPAVEETRPVLGLIDEEAVLTPEQISLAEYLSESTLAPLSACINAMLPPGLNQMADVLYSLASGQADEDRSKLSDKQQRLLALLERRGELRGRQIDAALPRIHWRPTARGLVRRGTLTSRPVLPPPSVRPKLVRTAQLACPPEAAREKLPDLGRAGSTALKRRQAIVRFLMKEFESVDVSWVYAASGGKPADLRYLAERGLVSLGESEVWRDPLENVDYIPLEPPILTRGQEAAWTEICTGIQEALGGRTPPPYLLHGVTGSGKTEIYLRAVAETLRYGKQVIVLVPEIALTPQTVRRFLSRFPGNVGLMHSRLSTGERYDTWRRARGGELGVIIGPRSALFTPLPDLGLIVVDESHDDSYYQDEIQPYYHAREVAVAYARLAGAVCLLGTATPDITSQFQAASGHWKPLLLPTRILAHRESVKMQLQRLAIQQSTSRYRELENQAETLELPPVKIVDMRVELKAGNRSIFSRALQGALADVLARGQQAILFLNRRGAATYVFCRDCGQSLVCPRCNLPLTYHSRSPFGSGGGAGLACHHCGYQRKMPLTCPNCGSRRIKAYGTGTERVEAEVQALLPEARTLRWDYETTRQKGAHDIILSHFSNHRANILVGTQMLAKGLDLPLVTLVGVILADVGLNLPDYRAPERTFQVLTQVAGRAGRSPLGGQVFLQTFEPDHYVIQAASRHDYGAFYEKELAYRRQLGYPPYTQLVRLEYRHPDSEYAGHEARRFASQIRAWLAAGERVATRMIGPAPCFFARVSGLYRWQIILSGPNPASLLRDRPVGEWRVEVNPASLL